MFITWYLFLAFLFAFSVLWMVVEVGGHGAVGGPIAGALVAAFLAAVTIIYGFAKKKRSPGKPAENYNTQADSH